MKTIFGHTWEQIDRAQHKTGSLNEALPPMSGKITPSQYEKNEWSRMAQDAYSKDLNDIGHKFSVAATLAKGESVAVTWFDDLQNDYRAWLVGGFK
jgi:hypothetical protein